MKVFMPKSDLDKRKRLYQKSFRKYGVSHRAARWLSKDAMLIRYENLFADLNLEGKSIFEAGCGFGDAIPFINARAVKFSYTGVDLVPEFISEAKKRFPEQNFQMGDFRDFIKPHDIIICSGALNYKTKDSVSDRKNIIKLLFDNTKCALAFNMAGYHPQPKNYKNYKVYYADSLKILNFCLKLTPKVIFRHHYRPKDFTIVMFK